MRSAWRTLHSDEITRDPGANEVVCLRDLMIPNRDITPSPRGQGSFLEYITAIESLTGCTMAAQVDLHAANAWLGGMQPGTDRNSA